MLGGVLSQVYDGKERVGAYTSRTLNKSERKYSVTRKELLALVDCIQKFSSFGEKVCIEDRSSCLEMAESI